MFLRAVNNMDLRRIILAALLCVGGLSVTGYLVFDARRTENLAATVALENSCEGQAAAAYQQLRAGATMMRSMAHVIDLLPDPSDMSQDRWNEYTSSLIEQGNWTVLSFSRVEIVIRAEMQAWEKRTGLRIVRVDQDGQLIPVERNDPAYLPIVNTYPRNAKLLGLDNLFERSRRDAVIRGLSSGELSVSLPFNAPLNNPTGVAQKAFLLFLPIYDKKRQSCGGITEAYFERSIIEGRNRDGVTYSLSVQGQNLFSDPTNPGWVVGHRSFTLGSGVFRLTCTTSVRRTPTWILIAVLGSFIALLLPALFVISSVLSSRHQKAALLALQNSKEQTLKDELNQFKASFLNNISHNLRTPLNAVCNGVDFLFSGLVSEEQQSYAPMIRSGLSSLVERIEDLIDYSEFEAGNVVPREDVVLLSDVATELTTLVAAKTESVRFHLSQDSGPPAIIVDRKLLMKVLKNMLVSRCRVGVKGEVELIFRVADSQRGMFLLREKLSGFPAKTADELFAFDVARKAVSLLNGEVEKVADQQIVYIPCGFVDELPKAQTLRNNDLGRVLVVDDNPLNRVVLCKMLDRLGFCDLCDEAEDGRVALSWIVENPNTRLVLMDIQMPVLDGYEAAGQMRLNGFRGKIFAVTANVDIYQRTGKTDFPFDEILQKPIKKAELERVLQKWSLVVV